MTHLKSIMNQSILQSVCVTVSIILSSCRVNGIFINPEPSISNLSQWTLIQVDQTCVGNCYSDFTNISCRDSHICHTVSVCNGRTSFPVVEYPLKTWPKSIGNNGCEISDKPPSPPPSATFVNDGDQETLIVDRSVGGMSPCYVYRNGSVDSIFTLVFWLKASCANCTVLEFSHSTTRQPIHLNVINEQFCVNLDCQSLPNISQQWALISARLVREKLIVFIKDKPFKNMNPTLTNVNASDIFIGSRDSRTSGDVIQLTHVRYYRDALTTIEIESLRTGFSNPVIGECQCPTDYLEYVDENNCTDGVSYYPRFNTTTMLNAINATIDNDNNTYWASSNQGNVTLILHFNISFQIESILIKFASALPNNVSYSLFSGNQQMSLGFFQCDSSCKMNVTNSDNKFSKAEMAGYVADRVQIQLFRHAPEQKINFIVSTIEITGRCNCNGNADKCLLNYENQTYSCSCNQDTNTEGQYCQSCSPNFFHSLDQYDCSNSCHCNTEGVANVSNQCEEIGGRCKCKRNVEGQMCDTCKPLYYKPLHGDSPTDGCIGCSCNQIGTLKCNESDGSCICRPNTQYPSCDKCLQYSYGFNNPVGCQPCNCKAIGAIGQDQSCNESTGQCNCKTNVQGLKCGTCKPGFYSLESANQQGCTPCECHSVGSNSGACEIDTGQCQCRGNVTTNKHCIPVIISVDPTYGPFIGGTLVTIHGNLLGNTTHNLAVFLNDFHQDLVSVSDTVVIFRTVTFNTSSQLTQQLKLSWKDESSPFSTQIAFTYRSDPVIDITKAQNVTTIVSGGCQVKVYGTNLESVKYPQLEISLASNPMNKTISLCRHATDYVICPIPDLKGLNTSSIDKLQMTALFDGVNSSDIGNVEVKPDPQFDNVGTIKFQYPFENTIILSGKNISAACQMSDYTVFTGVISCAIVHISNTEIECAPAVSRPGGYKYYPIKVIVGNIHKTVGTLQYLELRETTGFIIIISCVSVAVAIAIAIIIFCIFWHKRKASKAATPLISANKEVVTGETNTLNNYSEIPENVPEPPVVTNGHIEPVLRETIFQEPKKGIVNTEAEDTVLREEFLPKVDADLRESIRKCYVGVGHFVTGKYRAIKGKKYAVKTIGAVKIQMYKNTTLHPG